MTWDVEESVATIAQWQYTGNLYATIEKTLNSSLRWRGFPGFFALTGDAYLASTIGRTESGYSLGIDYWEHFFGSSEDITSCYPKMATGPIWTLCVPEILENALDHSIDWEEAGLSLSDVKEDLLSTKTTVDGLTFVGVDGYEGFQAAALMHPAFVYGWDGTYENLGLTDSSISILRGAYYYLLNSLHLSAKNQNYMADSFYTFEKYADRIKNYSGTAIKAFNKDGSEANLEPIVEYIDSLASAGNAGTDILQNLTDQQIALKEAAFYRQSGDSSSGLIPKQEIISSKVLEAINFFMSVSPTKSVSISTDMRKKGNKCICIGLPAGSVEQYDASTDASIHDSGDSDDRHKKQMLDIGLIAYNYEYQNVVLEPIMRPFIANLFVLPESFDDVTIASCSGIRDLAMKIKFLLVEVSVQEGTSADSQIVLKEDIRFDILDNLYSDLGSKRKAAATNVLISYLMENYYKLASGLSINEDTFPSTSDSLGLSINSYASSFSESLAGEFESYSSEVSSAVSQVFDSMINENATYNSVASSFTTELSSTEYEDLADEILDSATNAAGSRLYTAESMRDLIVGAKRFDRVVFLPVHPDDFSVRYDADVYNGGSGGYDSKWGVPNYFSASTAREDGPVSYTDGSIIGITTAAILDELIEHDVMESTSQVNTLWGDIVDTGIKFKERTGDETTNFYRIFAIIHDQSTAGSQN